MRINQILRCVLTLLTALGYGALAHSEEPHEVYLPLGDSYTIGQGVLESERFPNQLVRRLREKNIQLELGGNPARSGWTTRDAERTELGSIARLKPTMVTLLIGVNDQVQGSTSEEFQSSLSRLLNRIQEEMKAASRNPKRVILISIPDYSLTPNGATYAMGRNAPSEILRFNSIIAAEAKARNLGFVDISAISNAVKDEPNLIAADGLHPSGLLYARWAEAIEPEVIRLLQKERGTL